MIRFIVFSIQHIINSFELQVNCNCTRIGMTHCSCSQVTRPVKITFKLQKKERKKERKKEKRGERERERERERDVEKYTPSLSCSEILRVFCAFFGHHCCMFKCCCSCLLWLSFECMYKSLRSRKQRINLWVIILKKHKWVLHRLQGVFLYVILFLFCVFYFAAVLQLCFIFHIFISLGMKMKEWKWLPVKTTYLSNIILVFFLPILIILFCVLRSC